LWVKLEKASGLATRGTPLLGGNGTVPTVPVENDLQSGDLVYLIQLIQIVNMLWLPLAFPAYLWQK
jgi:hypothetical protein